VKSRFHRLAHPTEGRPAQANHNRFGDRIGSRQFKTALRCAFCSAGGYRLTNWGGGRSQSGRPIPRLPNKSLFGAQSREVRNSCPKLRTLYAKWMLPKRLPGFCRNRRREKLAISSPHLQAGHWSEGTFLVGSTIPSGLVSTLSADSAPKYCGGRVYRRTSLVCGSATRK